jgi:hypothetical protein
LSWGRRGRRGSEAESGRGVRHAAGFWGIQRESGPTSLTFKFDLAGPDGWSPCGPLRHKNRGPEPTPSRGGAGIAKESAGQGVDRGGLVVAWVSRPCSEATGGDAHATVEPCKPRGRVARATWSSEISNGAIAAGEIRSRTRLAAKNARNHRAHETFHTSSLKHSDFNHGWQVWARIVCIRGNQKNPWSKSVGF